MLDSQIFNYEFDYDEWPSTHHDPSEELRPFNENMFMLRKYYSTVFDEEKYWPLEKIRKEKPSLLSSSKVYKIKYSLNMLPQIGAYVNKQTDPYTFKVSEELTNVSDNLLDLCANQDDELEMFESESL